MHSLARRLGCFEAAYVCAFALCVTSNVARGQDTKKDIPSIAREARKCVVTIETKDALGKSLSLGSGFLVSNDGRVVTNYHVIQEAASGTVRFADGASYVVEGLVASNQEKDLVVLK